MSSRSRVAILAFALCTTAAACEGRRPDLVAPHRATASIEALLGPGDTQAIESADVTAADVTAPDVAPSDIATGGQASGHTDTFATPTQNVFEQRYSFNARSVGAYPAARGEFEAHSRRFTGEAVVIHAEVTCMAIVGSQAYIGARITKATVDQVEQPNAPGVALVFNVRDNGEGDGVADDASLFYLGYTSEIAYCNSRPLIPVMRPSTNANVQVRPE